MVINLKFFVDESGSFRADSEPPYELVGMLLMVDIQQSVNHCNIILNAISSVVNGEVDTWSGTGNAHTVFIGPDKVRIRSEFEPFGECEVPLDDFQAAVEGWVEFIKNEPHPVSVVPSQANRSKA